MKIVIAPDSFKGSIYALDVASAIKEGIYRVVPEAETILVPVADGGDGTLETLVDSSGGKIHRSQVTGPLGKKVLAEWGALGDGRTAVIEMARSSGLALLDSKNLNPLISTTFGLGEIILAALNTGLREFIVGIGGSATNDGGAGMAQALGVLLVDNNGSNLSFGGEALSQLAQIDMSGLDPRICESRFSIACDVSNPLTGTEGASAVYGPQKGATPNMIRILDASLLHLANIVSRDIGLDINNVPGSGAAGGLGGGMIAFLNGSLRKGSDIILDTIGLDTKLDNVDLVITGEGSLDYQTIYDKAPISVAKRAKVRGIPVIAIAGTLGERYHEVHHHGIDAAIAITNSPMSLHEASTDAFKLIANATEQALRFMATGSQLRDKMQLKI